MSEKLSETVEVTNKHSMDVDFAGINISIGKLFGEKVVDEMITRISPEEFNVLFKYMHDQTWSKNYNDEPILKFTKPNSWSSSKSEPPTLAKYALNELSDKLKLVIQEKVEEIVKSEEFIKKADDIAQELVDYATEGYKKDMKERLKSRLVGNITDGATYYDGISLIDIIRYEINNMIHV